MPAQSKPAGVAPQERLKPSTAEYIFDLKKRWDESRILSTIGHIYSIIHTSSITLKIAYFNCILTNHGWTLSTSTITSLLTQQCVTDLMQWVLGKYAQITGNKNIAPEGAPEEPIPDIPDGMNAQSFLGAAFDGETVKLIEQETTTEESWWSKIKFDPKLGFDQKEPISKQLFGMLKNNMGFLRPIIGIIAVIACVSGFDGLLECKWLANLSLAVVKLAASIKGAGVIWENVNNGIDAILKLIYSAFGETYYSKAEQEFKTFTDRVNKLREDTQILVDKSQYDVFGFLRTETIAELTATLDDLNQQQVTLTNKDKLSLGMNPILLQINNNLQALRDRRAALVGSGNKQVPVKVWFFAGPGHGKSYVAGRLAKDLSPGRPAYTKSPLDQYASGYRGNDVWISDDIYQNASSESPDVKDWMMAATSAAYALNQAALQQKGMPFTSRFMIATSNFAYAPNNVGIRSNLALDRRRDYLVYTYYEGLDEYISKTGQNPPESFYSEHKQRFFLFTPRAPSEGSDIQVKGIPKPTTPGYIGEISYADLVTMCLELEKCRAEAYRQYLLSFFAVDNPSITIPAEPFKFDSYLFECEHIFDPVTKQQRYQISPEGVRQYRALLKKQKEEKDLTLSQDTDDDSLMEEMARFAPVRVQTIVRAKSVVFSGTPGIGKTFQINRYFGILQTNPIRVNDIFIQTPNWFDKIVGSGEHVYFDDFSTSPELTTAFVKCVVAYDENTLGIRSLIATCNWTRLSPETADLIKRRSQCVEVSLATRNNIARKMKRLSVEEYLRNTCGDDQPKRSQAISLKFTPYLEDPPEYIVIPEWLQEHFENNVVRTTTRIVESFDVPCPDSFDYSIFLDICGCDDDPAQIMQRVLNASVLHHVAGKAPTPVNNRTKLYVATKVVPLMKTLAFKSSPENWTAIFNQEEHAVIVPGIILISVKHDAFGYSETEQLGFVDVEGKIVAFKVEAGSAPVQVIDGRLHHNHVPIVFPDGNEVYQEACKRMWTKTVDIDRLSVSSDEFALNLMRTSQFGQIFSLCITGACLIADGLTVAAFLGAAVGDIKEKFVSKFLPKEENKPEEESVRPVHQVNEDGPKGSKEGKEAKEKALKKEIHVEESIRPVHQVNEDGPKGSKEGKDAKEKNKQKDIQVEESVFGDVRSQHSADSSGVPDSERGKQSNAGTKTAALASDEDEKPYFRDHEETHVSTYDRDIWNTKGTPWWDEESAYDRIGKRFPVDPIVIEADGEPRQGTVCWNNTTKYFGVSWNGQIVYAHEYRHSQWMIIAVPYNTHWKPISIKDIDHPSLKRFERSNLSAETGIITLTIGKSFDAGNAEDVDFSSIFAFTISGGVPYDAFLKAVRADVLNYIFNPTFGNVLPSNARQYLKRNAPNLLAQFDYNINQEGTQDPVMIEQSYLAVQNSVQIFAAGRHCVFGLKIAKRYILSVAHAHKHGPLTVKIQDKVYPLTLVCMNKRDMAIYEIQDKTCPQFKDITHIFVDAEELMSYLGAITTAIPTCLVIPAGNQSPIPMTTYCQADALTRETSEIAFRGKTISYRSTVGNFFTTGVSKNGDCGASLFMANKSLSGKLIGIHRAGCNGSSLSAIVTRQWIREIVNRPTALQETAFEIKQEAAILDEHATIKHHESVQMYEMCKVDKETGLLQVGLLDKAVFNPTSTRIRRTGILLSDKMAFEPSIMNENDPRANGFRPMPEGLKRYGHSYLTEEINEMEVFEAADAIGNHCTNEILKRNKTVRVFSNTEVLNTPPILEYCNAKPLDRNGSPGYPHIVGNAGQCKGDFLYQNPKDGKWYVKPQKMELLNNVNEILKDAAQGVEHIHPLVAYCKDEPLKLKKIYDVQKTRLFFSCPFEYLICFRRYFNAGMYRVQELYNDLPPKIGINGQNFADWHYMTSRLERMSPIGFASDVESFDASVPKIFIQACTRIWNQIYSRCSQDGEDIQKGNKIRETLHKAIEGAYVISRKRMFKLSQAQVSGNPATAIENSFIVWMLYYLVWRRLAEKNDPALASYAEFRNHVELICYGDDNLCTVSLKTPWFNFNSFAKEAKRFGFKITDAAKKGGDIPDFQTLEEMDFLKRGFKKINGLAVGPLDTQSIEKSCEWIRGKKYEVTEDVLDDWPISTERQLIAQSIDSQWPEMALHGLAYYQQIREKLLKEAGKNGISLNPPTWEAALLSCGYAL